MLLPVLPMFDLVPIFSGGGDSGPFYFNAQFWDYYPGCRRPMGVLDSLIPEPTPRRDGRGRPWKDRRAVLTEFCGTADAPGQTTNEIMGN